MKYLSILVISVFLTACNNNQPEQTPIASVASGDTVFVHYIGSVIDGGIFESTLDGEPRGIIVGEHAILPAFEDALVGMQPGESKSFTLAPEQAFGPYRDDPGMTHTLDRASLAHSINPVVGQQLNAAVFLPDQPTGQSQIVPVVITAVTEQTITVDANHPLAGKSLNFDVTVVEIQKKL
ncbi:MAG: peptidylprolyl isomerase [Gammaproteobacteria bacterium]|nr:peptidylprolyl isomerase [Gammaproteobacteria bacterium]